METLMKKNILLFLCICISKFSHAAEKTAPPAYDAEEISGGSSSRVIHSATSGMENFARQYFLKPFEEGNVQEMITRAARFEKGDSSNPRNLLYCLGLLSLATAFETDGSASWQIARTIRDNNGKDNNIKTQNQSLRQSYVSHAAFLGNADAQANIKDFNIWENELVLSNSKKKANLLEPSQDIYAESFKETIERIKQSTPQQLHDHALTLLTGSHDSNPQPVRALAIAAYLERSYQNDWQGPELLMLFAAGGCTGNSSWWQHVIPVDVTLAEQYAIIRDKRSPSTKSKTWVAHFAFRQGKYNDAQKLAQEALQIDPNYQSARGILREIKNRTQPDICVVS